MLANYISLFGLDSISLPTRIRRDSEIDLLPITDIAFTSDTIPCAYQCIKKTINNTKASLTVGNFLFKDIYISIARNKEKAPLKGLYIINEGDEIPKGYELLELCNTSFATKSLSLIGCRDKNNTTSFLSNSIMEIVVVNLTLKEVIPRGFNVVTYLKPSSNISDNSLNTSFGGDIIVLAVRYMSKHADVAFESSLLSRFPEENLSNHEFPDGVAQFCFPSGITLSKIRIKPLYFSFVMTNNNGDETFGSAIMLHEHIDIDSFFDVKSNRNSAWDMATNNRSSLSSASKKVEGNYFWVPKCVCILSKSPNYAIFRQFLKFLYRRYHAHSSLNSKICVENYIAFFLNIPLPAPGFRSHVHLAYTPFDNRDKCCHFMVEQSNLGSLPPMPQFALSCLLRCLPSTLIVEIFGCILAERKIAFIANSRSILHKVIEAFRVLLFPFAWRYTYVPILPNSMRSILQTFLPFLVGIHTSLHAYIGLSDEIVVVDIDALPRPKIVNNFKIKPHCFSNFESNDRSNINTDVNIPIGNLFNAIPLQDELTSYPYFIVKSPEIPAFQLPLRYSIPLIMKLDSIREKLPFHEDNNKYAKLVGESDADYQSWVESELFDGVSENSNAETVPRTLLVERQTVIEETIFQRVINENQIFKSSKKSTKCPYCINSNSEGVEDTFYGHDKSAPLLSLLIRTVFLHTLISLVGNFRQFLKRSDISKESRRSFIFEDIFHIQDYVASFPLDVQCFIKQLTQTQAFQSFIMQAYQNGHQLFLPQQFSFYFDSCVANSLSNCSNEYSFKSRCKCSGNHDTFEYLYNYILKSNPPTLFKDVHIFNTNKWVDKNQELLIPSNSMPYIFNSFFKDKSVSGNQILFPNPIIDRNIISSITSYHNSFCRDSFFERIMDNHNINYYFSFYRHVLNLSLKLATAQKSSINSDEILLSALADPLNSSNDICYSYAAYFSLSLFYYLNVQLDKTIVLPFNILTLNEQSKANLKLQGVFPLISSPRGRIASGEKRFLTPSHSRRIIGMLEASSKVCLVGFDEIISNEKLLNILMSTFVVTPSSNSSSLASLNFSESLNQQALIIYFRLILSYSLVFDCYMCDVFICLFMTIVRNALILISSEEALTCDDKLIYNELTDTLQYCYNIVPYHSSDINLERDIKLVKSYLTCTELWSTSLSLSIFTEPSLSALRSFSKIYYNICQFPSKSIFSFSPKILSSICMDQLSGVRFKTNVSSCEPFSIEVCEFKSLLAIITDHFIFPLTLKPHSICPSCCYTMTYDDILVSWMEMVDNEHVSDELSVCICPACGLETPIFLSGSGLDLHQISDLSPKRFDLGIKTFKVPLFPLSYLMYKYPNFEGVITKNGSSFIVEKSIVYSLLFHLAFNNLPYMFLFTPYIQSIPLIDFSRINKENNSNGLINFFDVQFIPRQLAVISLNPLYLSIILLADVSICSSLSTSIDSNVFALCPLLAANVLTASYKIIEYAWRHCDVCNPLDLVYILKLLSINIDGDGDTDCKQFQFGLAVITKKDLPTLIKIRGYLHHHKVSEAVHTFLKARESCDSDELTPSFFHQPLFQQLLYLRNTLYICTEIDDFILDNIDSKETIHPKLPVFSISTNHTEVDFFEKLSRTHDTKAIITPSFISSGHVLKLEGSFFNQNDMFSKTYSISLQSADTLRTLLLPQDKVPTIGHITTAKIIAQNIINNMSNKDEICYAPSLKSDYEAYKSYLTEIIRCPFVAKDSFHNLKNIAKIPFTIPSKMHLPQVLPYMLDVFPPISCLSATSRILLFNNFPISDFIFGKSNFLYASLTAQNWFHLFAVDPQFQSWIIDYLTLLNKSDFNFSCNLGAVVSAFKFLVDIRFLRSAYSDFAEHSSDSAYNAVFWSESQKIYRRYFDVKLSVTKMPLNLSPTDFNLNSNYPKFFTTPPEPINIINNNYEDEVILFTHMWPNEFKNLLYTKVFLPHSTRQAKNSTDPLLGIGPTFRNPILNRSPNLPKIAETSTIADPTIYDNAESILSAYLVKLLTPLINETIMAYQLLLLNRKAI